MRHNAIWMRIADMLMANGEPLSSDEIAEHMGLTVNHVSTTLVAYPHVFERLSGGNEFGSGRPNANCVWSTHQLEAARLRVLYGEKPVIRGVADVRAMVRHA